MKMYFYQILTVFYVLVCVRELCVCILNVPKELNLTENEEINLSPLSP